MKKETVRNLFSNLFSLGFSNMSASVFYFFLTIYLARVLGVENFGRYEFSIAIFVIFSLFAELGTAKIGTREIARLRSGDRSAVSSFTARLLSIRFVTSFLAFIALILFVLIMPKSTEVKYVVALNGIVLLFSFMMLEWFFMGIEKMGYIAVSRVLNAAFFLLFALLFVKNGGDLLFVPFARIASTVIAVFFLVFLYTRNYGSVPFSFSASGWKNILAASLPVLTAAAMAKVYLKFDTVILGFMKTDSDVGVYAAMYRIILFFLGFRAVAVSAIFPSLSRFFKTSSKELSDVVRLAQKTAAMFALPIGVGGTMLAEKIIVAVYGPEYLEGAMALKILMWSFVMLSLNFTYPQLEIACDRERIYMYFMTMGSVLNVVMNFALIPKFGIEGAACATVLSDVLTFGLFYYKARDLVSVNMLKIVLAPVIASVAMGSVLFFLRGLGLFSAVFVGAAVYFMLIFLLGYVKKGEILYLKTALTGK